MLVPGLGLLLEVGARGTQERGALSRFFPLFHTHTQTHTHTHTHTHTYIHIHTHTNTAVKKRHSLEQQSKEGAQRDA